MASQQPNLDEISRRLRGEARKAAEILAPRLFPKNQLGMKELSNDDFMAYTARHWREPDFRTSTLKRIGSRAFLDLTNELWQRFPAEELVPPAPAMPGMAPQQPGVDPNVDSGIVPPPQTIPNAPQVNIAAPPPVMGEPERVM
jgi:hypothetical protein